MLIKALQQLIAPKSIGKVNRALTGMVLDVGQKALSRDPLHHLGLAIIPLYKGQEDVFALRPSLYEHPQSRTHPSQSQQRAWCLPVAWYEKGPSSVSDIPE